MNRTVTAVAAALAGCLLNLQPIGALGQPVPVAGSEPQLRVQLFDTSATLRATPTGPGWKIVAADGSAVAELNTHEATSITLNGSELIIGTGLPIAVSALPLRLQSSDLSTQSLIRLSPPTGGTAHEYPSPIELKPQPGAGISLIAELPMEDYLRGVVPHEIGLDSPHQAKCAQAVAARSFAMLALTRKNHAGRGYHLCSTVCCQVYGGLGRSTPASDLAITETRGYILTFEGKAIPAYYAGHCGGHTEDIRVSWPSRGNDRAYHGASRFDGPEKPALNLQVEEDFVKWLASSPACYCNPEKFDVPQWAGKNLRWTREVTAEELGKWVARRKDVGRIIAIRPGERGHSGRLKSAEFVGEKGTLTASPEYDIRRVFQPYLRSGAFTVEPQGGTPDRPEKFLLRGAGSGHGVGMCQTGAMGMANAGNDFRAILQHYYPNAKVEQLYK